MVREVLVDSSGLYALADHRDASRSLVERCLAGLLQAGTGLVLTDYIIDEACTLAKARAGSYGALRLLEIVEQSQAFGWFGSARNDSRRQSPFSASTPITAIRLRIAPASL